MNSYNGLKIAVVGCGKWGINHVKTAASLIGAKNVIVCDSFSGAEDKVKSVSDEIIFTNDFNSILTANCISGVIVATPAETHFEITRQLLVNGKNVLV